MKQFAMVGLILLASLSAREARATIITYEVAPVAGDTFEYHYVVDNDSLVEFIEEFTVYFDRDLFENLRMPGAPVGWDPLVIQPDLILSDDGFYDVLALVVGIGPGTSLGGFTVWADFLGVGSPGSQPFDIFDPNTLAVIDTGFTVPVSAVPEASTLFTLGAGLLALGVFRRR